MTPFYFGTRARRLFGVYEPGEVGGRVAVICNPFGEELVHAHRSLRQLARRLTEMGWDVLRFDYFGTGDSDGEIEAATLAGWREDIATAVEEALSLSGSDRVTLIGLRLGGLLAAAAAGAVGAQCDRLVLWDPVSSGPAYLAALAAEDLARRDGARSEGHAAQLGYALPPAMAAELRAAELAPLIQALPESVPQARRLAVVSDNAAPIPASLPAERVEAVRCWVDKWPEMGVLPVAALQRITAFMQ